jgi:hypothetical protein
MTLFHVLVDVALCLLKQSKGRDKEGKMAAISDPIMPLRERFFAMKSLHLVNSRHTRIWRYVLTISKNISGQRASYVAFWDATATLKPKLKQRFDNCRGPNTIVGSRVRNFSILLLVSSPFETTCWLARRDASIVYQFYCFPGWREFLRFAIVYVYPNLRLNVFKKRIQKGLQIAPNIAAIHPPSLRIVQWNRLLKPINGGFNWL